MTDTLFGTSANDSLTGGVGNDCLLGFAGDDTLSGANGDDELIGGLGADSLSGDDGNDTLSGYDDDDTVSGGNGLDLIRGHDGNDSLLGEGGVDLIFGGLGGDFISGGLNNDRLKGDAGNDTIHGDEGNDVINAGEGADNLRGGEGRDRLHGDAGADTLFGGADRDTLRGGLDNDRLHGGDENDLLKGDGGNDLLFGDNGDDRLEGGGDDDTLNGGQGNDTLRGDSGSDLISGGNGDDLIVGGAGDDTLGGDGGRDTLLGGSGADVFSLTNGALDIVRDFEVSVDKLDMSVFDIQFAQIELQDVNGGTLVRSGGADIAKLLFTQADQLSDGDFVGLLGTLPNEIVGTGGDDTLTGTEIAELITALDGNDLVQAEGGNDTVDGGRGRDTIFGGDGDDSLTASGSFGASPAGEIHGGAGNDTIDGLFGLNEIFGGDGDDALSSLAFVNRVFGGAGNDTIRATLEGQSTLEGGAGNDNLRDNDLNSGEADILRGDGGDDSLHAEQGSDSLFGGEGNDTLRASDSNFPGADLLDGGAGNDSLLASDAGATLIGGAGLDTLSLGGGNDVITVSAEETETDIVSNFDATSDLIDLGNRSVTVSDLTIVADGADALIGASGQDFLRLQNVVAEDLTESSFLGLLTGSLPPTVSRTDTYFYKNDENENYHGTDGDDQFFLNYQRAKDVFTGDGTDIIHFTHTLEAYNASNAGKVRIHDFEIGVDRLNIASSGIRYSDLQFTQLADGTRIHGLGLGKGLHLQDLFVTTLDESSFIGLLDEDAVDLDVGFTQSHIGTDGADRLTIHLPNFKDGLYRGGDDYVHSTSPTGDHHGEAGNDVIIGGSQVFGGDGDDQLIGHDPFNIYHSGRSETDGFGGAGSDLIVSGSAFGGDGDDIVLISNRFGDGGAGNDDILLDQIVLDRPRVEDEDVVLIGEGHDRVFGFEANKTHFDLHWSVNSFADLDISQQGADVLLRDPNGDNSVLFKDLLIADLNEGDFDNIANEIDFVVPDGFVGLAGSTRNDLEFFNTVEDRAYHAKGGDDVLLVRGGDHILHGGNGDDDINAKVFSGTTNGVIDDDATADDISTLTLFGGDGVDRMDIFSLIDAEIFGGGGNDQIVISTFDTTAEAHGDGGDDIIALVERSAIPNDDDFGESFELFGGQGNDTIQMASFEATAFGGDGDDVLAGGDGGDTLVGDAGTDTLTGGAGDDVFVVAADEDSVDIVTDFSNGPDRIDLSALNVSLSDVLVVDDGADVLIRVSGTDVLRLQGIEPAAVDDSDFIF